VDVNILHGAKDRGVGNAGFVCCGIYGRCDNAGDISVTFYAHISLRPLPAELTVLKPSGHVMHQQFNIQQLYALSTPYLCVLYLSENKQRLVPLTA